MKLRKSLCYFLSIEFPSKLHTYELIITAGSLTSLPTDKIKHFFNPNYQKKKCLSLVCCVSYNKLNCISILSHAFLSEDSFFFLQCTHSRIEVRPLETCMGMQTCKIFSTTGTQEGSFQCPSKFQATESDIATKLPKIYFLIASLRCPFVKMNFCF